MVREGRGSGWGWKSRLRLSDLELIKSWEEMAGVDGVFACDVFLVNRRPLDPRSGLLGWAMRGEMVRRMRMNGGVAPWPSPTAVVS